MFESIPSSNEKSQEQQENDQEKQNDAPEVEQETAQAGLSMLERIQSVKTKIDSLLDNAQEEKERKLLRLQQKSRVLRRAGLAALLAVAVGAGQEVSAQDLQAKAPSGGPNVERTNSGQLNDLPNESNEKADSTLTKYQRQLMRRFSGPLDNEGRQILDVTQRLNMDLQQQFTDEDGQDNREKQKDGFDVSPGLSSFEVSFNQQFSDDSELDRLSIAMEVEGNILQKGNFSPSIDSPEVEVTVNF